MDTIPLVVTSVQKATTVAAKALLHVLYVHLVHSQMRMVQLHVQFVERACIAIVVELCNVIHVLQEHINLSLDHRFAPNVQSVNTATQMVQLIALIVQ